MRRLRASRSVLGLGKEQPGGRLLLRSAFASHLPDSVRDAVKAVHCQGALDTAGAGQDVLVRFSEFRVPSHMKFMIHAGFEGVTTGRGDIGADVTPDGAAAAVLRTVPQTVEVQPALRRPLKFHHTPHQFYFLRQMVEPKYLCGVAILDDEHMANLPLYTSLLAEWTGRNAARGEKTRSPP